MKSNRQKVLFISLGSILGLTLAITGAFAAKKSEPEDLPIKDVQRFTTAISQIKSYYVKPVEDEDLFEDAIRGMLEGLDPHSSYLDIEELKSLRQSTKGEFSGLGIEVTMDKGIIKVISPIDDTPAYKAGIKSGDYIIRLDDKPVKGMTLRDAVNKMRGLTGTKIVLTVVREGETKPLTIEVVRKKITINSVKSKMLEDKYGYVRISHFQSPTSRALKKEIASLKKQAGGKLKGLVVDLRNNPGGLLDSAIEVSDLFIHNDRKGKEELIVYTKGRLPGSEFTAKATPGDMLDNAPIVVLINGGSASGSEIVAGALKDHERAILMGTKSFGKGSVQTVLPLDAERGIKLTTALYYTPDGVSIQAKGIEPDIMVKQIIVPKKKDDVSKIFSITEADLDNHLDNGNVKKGKKDKKVKAADKAATKKEEQAKSEDLIYTDYQLYEALNLLKGLVIAEKQRKNIRN